MIPAKALEAVTTEELARAATIFSSLKQLRMKLSGVQESVLDSAFESHVQAVLEKLETRIPQIDDSRAMESEVLMAKHGLFDAPFQQAIILCQAIAPALGDSLKDLRAVHSTYFSQLQQSIALVTSEENKMRTDLNRMHDDLQQALEDKERLSETLTVLDKENEDLKNQILVLRQQNRDLTADINDYRDGVVVGAVSTNRIVGNGLSFDTALPTTPNNPKNNPVTNSSSSSSVSSTSKGKRPVSAGGNKSSNNSTTSHNTNTGNAMSASGNIRSLPGSGSISAPMTTEQKVAIYRVEIQRVIDENRCREMSMNECLELIEKLYESKRTSRNVSNTNNYPNSQMNHNNLNNETMEQHFYRLMEKRYGLRNLAIEHSAMFVFALQRFQFESNEVMVFLKTFRSEIDEDFYLTQAELKRSIRDLLNVQVMARYPTKDMPTIQSYVDAKMCSFISEDEWTDMMNYLYNENDSVSINLILRKLAKEEMTNGGGGSGSSNSPGYEDSSSLSTSGGGGKNSPWKQQSSNASMFGNKSRAGSNVPNSGGVGVSSTPGNKGYGSSSVIGGGGSVSSSSGKLRLSQSSTAANLSANSRLQSHESLKLSFSKLLKAVLDFQLKSHEEYLRYFRDCFQKVDVNSDGVVDASQMMQCLSLMKQLATTTINNISNPHRYLGFAAVLPNHHSNNSHSNNNSGEVSDLDNDDYESLVRVVHMVDPLNSDIITFSQAVAVLSKISNTNHH